MGNASNAGPVIRATEQLVMLVKQDLTFEGLYKFQLPRTWEGCLELERKEYATYEDILRVAEDKPETIVKVLRICTETGLIDDITHDVLEAAGEDYVAPVPVFQRRTGLSRILGGRA